MEARLICALLFGTTVWADSYPRQTGLDIEHYAFHVSLHDDTDRIEGETKVTVRFRRAGVPELILDLVSTMKVNGVGLDGRPLRFTHVQDQLRIQFDSTAEAGAVRSVVVRYRGEPAAGLRIGPNLYGERSFFSVHWPNLAHHWLPLIDHPYDKATSEFLITAPSHYQVVANGLLQEITDLGDGRRLTHWKQSVAIASWLNAVAVAPFSMRSAGTVRGVALTNWVYRQDGDKGSVTFEPARKSIEFLSDYLGPYPFEKLANVQAAGFSGGTEYASVIFYGEERVTDKPATKLVNHEIAHQWFGNSVTENDWDDVWLSEGFATYFTLLQIEHSEGRDAFVAGLQQSRSAVAKLLKTLPDAPVIHRNLTDMSKVLNRLIYEKGAWTLHMLRGMVGNEVFRDGVRDYYERFRGGNASTADFQRVMEAHSGVALGWFFDQWLRRGGMPAVEWRWRYDAEIKGIRIRIEQTQGGEAYRFPLEVGVDGETVARVEVRKREEEFVVPAEKAPREIRLDPKLWILFSSSEISGR